MLRPGDVLSDRYRLDERLATGGMGDVWRATDLVLGRTVAVKAMLPALLEDPDFSARFRAEARMMASLGHKGVVNVFDYGESDVSGGRVAYLVMAYVAGEPLSGRIAAAGRLSVDETMSIVAQAAEALHAVHESGIIHRDVKPANLLVQPDATVVLVDFGIAHSPAATRLTAVNTVLGTALYMAPEQAAGRPVSPATDIYALGAVAYHCLAGHPPFTGDTPLRVAVAHMQDELPPLPEDIPAPVREVVTRALAKDPAARYPSGAAFAAAARAAAAGKTAIAAPVDLGSATMVAAPGNATLPTVVAAPHSPRPAAMSGGFGAPAQPTMVDARGYGVPPAVPPPVWPVTPGPAAGPPGRPGRPRSRRMAIALAVVPVLLGLLVLGLVLAFGDQLGAPWRDAPTSSPTPAAPATRAPTRTNGGTAPTRQTTAASPRPATPSATPGSAGPTTTPPPTTATTTTGPPTGSPAG